MLQKGIWEAAAEITSLKGGQKMEQALGHLVEKSSPLMKQLVGALNLSLLVCEMVSYQREGREAKLGWVHVFG